MKTLSASLKALVVASLACAASLASADTQTLNVNASVGGVCKFGTITPLNFGSIDPATLAADITVDTTVGYRCTSGTKPSALSVATATLAMTDINVPGSTLPFSLTLPAASTLVGTGFGSATQSTFTVNGKILQADAQAAMAGTYTQAVSLTITP